jgi:hypothetical protein
MRSAELTNLNNPIVRAVWPLRQAAADRAETEIKAMMDKILVDLEANGWDQDKVAPYPNNCWDRNYKPMVAKYHFVSSFTSGVLTSRSMRDPHIVKFNKEGYDREVKLARETAEIAYDSFVWKLCEKAGYQTVVDADLYGDHVWGFSILYVIHDDERAEKWKTKNIINHSKFGKPFYQWPTRKVK